MLTKGQLLKMLRLSSGFKQHEVAKKTKISSSYLSLIESGIKQPGNDVLDRLAQVYDIPVYLLYWDDDALQRTTNPKERKLIEELDKLLKQLFFLVVNR